VYRFGRGQNGETLLFGAELFARKAGGRKAQQKERQTSKCSRHRRFTSTHRQFSDLSPELSYNFLPGMQASLAPRQKLAHVLQIVSQLKQNAPLERESSFFLADGSARYRRFGSRRGD
jgi:hypothetical protein